jgi:hypothetical protein
MAGLFLEKTTRASSPRCHATQASAAAPSALLGLRRFGFEAVELGVERLRAGFLGVEWVVVLGSGSLHVGFYQDGGRFAYLPRFCA